MKKRIRVEKADFDDESSNVEDEPFMCVDNTNTLMQYSNNSDR